MHCVPTNSQTQKLINSKTKELINLKTHLFGMTLNLYMRCSMA